MRDINKFENVKYTSINGINVIDDSIGYMICEKIDSIDNDTHTLFIGKLVGCDVFSDEEAMSYQYFQKHKDDLIKVTTEVNAPTPVRTTNGQKLCAKHKMIIDTTIHPPQMMIDWPMP